MWVPSLPHRRASFDPLFAQVTPEEAAKQAEPMRSPTLRIEHHEMTHDDIAVAHRWFARGRRRARGGRDRRCRAARRPRVPARRVLVADHQPPHRRYGGPVGERRGCWWRCSRPSAHGSGASTRSGAAERARVLHRGHHAARTRSRRPSWPRRPAPTPCTCRPTPIRRTAIGFTEAHTTHFPGHFVRVRPRRQGAVSVPVIAVGRIEPRRPSGGSARCVRLRGDGPQAPRRSRPAQQARRGSSRRRAAVHVPLPVHQPDLHPRRRALRGNPATGRARAAARTGTEHPGACWSWAAARPAWRPPASPPCAATR